MTAAAVAVATQMAANRKTQDERDGDGIKV
jgi:hypothetical protein